MLPTLVNKSKTVKVKVNNKDVLVLKSLTVLLLDPSHCPGYKMNM